MQLFRFWYTGTSTSNCENKLIKFLFTLYTIFDIDNKFD